MKSGLIITAIFVTGALTGCSQSVPLCGDSETTELVIEISNQKIESVYGKEKASEIDLAVESIRTTDTNEKTGAFSCAANLSMSGPKGKDTLPITYTVEMTDNGDEFYVNVYGL